MEREIAASPERVWSLLTDAPRYPAWNPDVAAIKGTIADGQWIIVRTVDKSRTFRAKVVAPRGQGSVRFQFHPPIPPPPGWRRGGEGDSMVWRGGIPLGLLSQVRAFTVIPTTGGTTLLLEEYFSGPLMSLPLVNRLTSRADHWLAEWAGSLRKAAEA